MNKTWIIVALLVAVGLVGYSFMKSPETSAVEEAVEEATDAATDASEAVKEAVDDATEAAADVAKQAAEAVEEAATEATEAATDAVESAGAAMDDVLTTEGFDIEKVNALIDESSLDDTHKASLKTTVKSASESPELLSAALAQVKTALGM